MSRELTRIANKMMRLLMITAITKIASSLDHSTALVRAGLWTLVSIASTLLFWILVSHIRGHFHTCVLCDSSLLKSQEAIYLFCLTSCLPGFARSTIPYAFAFSCRTSPSSRILHQERYSLLYKSQQRLQVLFLPIKADEPEEYEAISIDPPYPDQKLGQTIAFLSRQEGFTATRRSIVKIVIIVSIFTTFDGHQHYQLLLLFKLFIFSLNTYTKT